MRIGLFGFPSTGKSALFRLLTGIDAATRSRPREARTAVAKVPDRRLDHLSDMYRPRKTTPATVEYVDLAGMEKGEAAKVLPLDQLRTADALAHVVRGFEDDAIPHGEGSIDPVRDTDTMETELILADHTIAERRVEKLESMARKVNGDDSRMELDVLRRCLEALESETPLRNLEFTEEEHRRLRGYTFLSMKPLLVTVNAGESDASKLAEGAGAFGLEQLARRPSTRVVALSAKIESEIAQLDPPDAAAFRSDLGIADPALDRMIRGSYELLGRISFFTVGEDECRAWTVPRGIAARPAAASVHSDIERGFIRAEVVPFDELVDTGGWSACRDRGTLRVEGKDYVVNDGDVVSFRFNV